MRNILYKEFLLPSTLKILMLLNRPESKRGHIEIQF